MINFSIENLKKQKFPSHSLYMIATPIGNIADITIRALYVLNIVNRIAVESINHASKLLFYYKISKPLILANKNNEYYAAKKIINFLKNGERIAYISNSGTPCISDPGAKIIDEINNKKISKIPIPGANALSTAISIAGTWIKSFSFFGFLPNKYKKQKKILTTLKKHPYSMVFYESPHRIKKFIKILNKILGKKRKIFICRELTKIYEESYQSTLEKALKWINKKKRQNGEFTLIIEGNKTKNKKKKQKY